MRTWTFICISSGYRPFCKFSAGGQEMTLSGLDVVKAGGRADYTYLTEGRVADTFGWLVPVTRCGDHWDWSR